MRDGFNIITDDDLHATLSCASMIGSPISSSVSRRSDTEGSSSGAPASQPNAGAAVVLFNLDACLKIHENQEAIAAERTADAHTALSGGEGA